MCTHAVCRAQKQVPKSLDVFGWCTWDAFYWQVSAKGVMDGLQSLHDGGVPPKLLVIDDGQCSVTTAMPFSLPFHQCHALLPAHLAASPNYYASANNCQVAEMQLVIRGAKACRKLEAQPSGQAPHSQLQGTLPICIARLSPS